MLYTSGKARAKMESGLKPADRLLTGHKLWWDCGRKGKEVMVG
jgi:hypothetical protein